MAKQKIDFRVTESGLVPASSYAKSIFNERNYKLNQIVRVDISKLRSNGLNKHSHNIAKMCVIHIDDFKEYEGRYHDALKRLQLEANAECDELMIRIPGIVDKVRAKQARSFTYENMGEERFKAAVEVICRHISTSYWPTLTHEEVSEMADQMD